MHATKILPIDYHQGKTLDLSGPCTVLWLNLAAIPLLFLFGWFFGRMITLLRLINPFANGFWGVITTFSVWNLITLILAVMIMIVVHELIHGLFFWLFTQEKPRFALRPGYAYAAAPEWYLPKFQYISVGLSPFVLISILCLTLAASIPPQIVPYLLLIATLNAAGALGDMIVVAWVFRLSNNILIRDQGDKFSSFAQQTD